MTVTRACIGYRKANPNNPRPDFRLNDAMGSIVILDPCGHDSSERHGKLQPLNAWRHENVKGHLHPLLYLQFPFKRSNAISETVQAVVGDS